MGRVISEVVNAEWIDIVDDKNKVIAQATRQQMRAENLCHRAAYIIVHDGMGKILIQRRTEMKDIYPSLLDATAGGVVTSGEGMLAAARREAEEELGIADVPFADMGFFIMKQHNVGCGVVCLAVSVMARLHYRKRKWNRFFG